MSAEAPVTLSSGQNLRNLAVTVIDPATNLPVTVLMEVVAIADANGDIIDFDQKDYNMQVLRKLNQIVIYLAMITNQNLHGDNMFEGEL